MDFRLPDRTLRAVLAVFGSITVVYCVLLLAYVATAPDVRLRVLLVDEPTPDAAGVPQPPAGIIIRKTPGLVYKGALPETGDRLIRINNQRISNALDYLQFMVHLRSMETPPGGWMLQGGNPLEHDMPRLVQ